MDQIVGLLVSCSFQSACVKARDKFTTFMEHTAGPHQTVSNSKSGSFGIIAPLYFALRKAKGIESSLILAGQKQVAGQIWNC